MTRRVNAAGLALVKEFEGLRLEAYRCPAGHWTIGWGHTGGELREGQRITRPQAEKLLRQDLAAAAAAVERLVQVALSDNQFAALASFVFNLGAAKFAGSTALKRLNAGDSDGAAAALEWWCKLRDPASGRLVASPGLKRRRAAEKALFLTPDALEELPAPRPDAVERASSERRDHPLAGRTGGGVGLVAGGGLVQSQQAEALVEQGSGLAAWLPWAGGLLIVAGLAWILWARIDDWRRGRGA